MSKEANRPIEAFDLLAPLAILGYTTPSGASGGIGVHSRLLSADKTLSSDEYIVAPTYFEIASGIELELGADSELAVL